MRCLEEGEEKFCLHFSPTSVHTLCVILRGVNPSWSILAIVHIICTLSTVFISLLLSVHCSCLYSLGESSLHINYLSCQQVTYGRHFLYVSISCCTTAASIPSSTEQGTVVDATGLHWGADQNTRTIYLSVISSPKECGKERGSIQLVAHKVCRVGV